MGSGWRWATDGGGQRMDGGGQRMGDGKVDGVIGILGVTKDRYNSYYA